MLWGSSELTEFCILLSKVLTLWHCVKVKQHCLSEFFVKYTKKSHHPEVRSSNNRDHLINSAIVKIALSKNVLSEVLF